ncbi:MAG TPA: DivIVA domain-containing protein [Acidimicrobiales bacterium]|nr:DivIVA domain-containing protein [Acidimicrobiales bacterium]
MSDGPLSPEEVAHRGFGTSFRGFDTTEVRAYLQRVANDLKEGTARERDLQRRLADAEHRAAHPVLQGDALTRALGDEMGRVLASAQEAANGLKDKAEENAARILREAHDQAQRIRAQAESILAVRTEEADAEAAAIRQGASSEAAAVLERARAEAAAAAAQVEEQARRLVQDAQAVRARVLGDLTRRRRLLQAQVEQLRAGRDRLLEAYRLVRATTDHVADELRRVEDEAREAAGAAGERAAAEPLPDVDVEALAAEAASAAAEEPQEAEPAPPAAAATEEPVEPAPADDRPADVEAEAVPQEPEPAGEERRPLRLLRPPEEPQAVEPEAVVPPEAEPEPDEAGAPGIDELFARIRAGRADAVARAKEVLGDDDDEQAAAGEVDAEPVAEAGPAGDEALLGRRDTAVEGIEPQLVRRLKRALQDEQNEVLDRLRSAKAGSPAAAVLPEPDAHAERYRQVAGELLQSAAAAGVAYVAQGEERPDTPDVAEVAAGLASSLVEPLRRALERALGGDDRASAGERVGAAYRECKAQRIEGLAGDAVVEAFSLGALAALPPGAPSRWVVDDDGRPCPDCDDNALAGVTPAGDAFPTGQAHPPAHAGCRCLLAPAGHPAAVSRTG